MSVCKAGLMSAVEKECLHWGDGCRGIQRTSAKLQNWMRSVISWGTFRRGAVLLQIRTEVGACRWSEWQGGSLRGGQVGCLSALFLSPKGGESNRKSSPTPPLLAWTIQKGSSSGLACMQTQAGNCWDWMSLCLPSSYLCWCRRCRCAFPCEKWGIRSTDKFWVLQTK